MTHEEIDAMPAGPELDALACKALGHRPRRRGCLCDGQECRTPSYCNGMTWRPISTNISEAIDWMGTKPGMMLLYGVDRDGEWLAKTAFPYADAVADTPELAIARAIAKGGLAK